MAFIGLPRAISWEDFTEVQTAPAGAAESAHASAKWSLSWGYKWDQEYILHDINVSVHMLADKSWVVKADKSSALLTHEQGHYDITALGARDLYREMPKLTHKTEAGLKAAVAALESRIKTEVKAMNVKYDGTTGGTNHGADSAAQTRWTGKIRLAVADDYATLSSIAS